MYLNNIPECYSTELNLVPASHSFTPTDGSQVRFSPSIGYINTLKTNQNLSFGQISVSYDLYKQTIKYKKTKTETDYTVVHSALRMDYVVYMMFLPHT